jgi:hypothetical protein
MPEQTGIPRSHRSFGWAWVLFALSLAVHVLDEAAHGFLSFYNPNVLTIRARIPWLPLPTFTLREFIVGLFAAVALLLALSPLAYRGTNWVRKAALPLALVAGILNGAQHIITSIVLRRMMPGVHSGPLLIATALFLIRTADRTAFRANENQPVS